MHLWIQVSLDPDRRGADRPQRWQYLECSRDLDAWRYILIHGRLARHSQEVKKEQIDQNPQTNHTSGTCRPPEPFASPFFSVQLSRRCTLKSLCMCVRVCVCVYRVVCTRPLPTFTEVSVPGKGKDARLRMEGAGGGRNTVCRGKLMASLSLWMEFREYKGIVEDVGHSGFGEKGTVVPQ